MGSEKNSPKHSVLDMRNLYYYDPNSTNEYYQEWLTSLPEIILN